MTGLSQRPTAPPVDVAPSRRRPAPGVRRAFLRLYVAAAALVGAGVILQAFSIVAYMRGAGAAALDLHTTGGFVTHSVEIVAFLAALVAFWGAWTRVGAALLLPVLGTAQVAAVGDTDGRGGWVNGLHGALALLVLLLAVALVQDGMRPSRRGT